MTRMNHEIWRRCWLCGNVYDIRLGPCDKCGYWAKLRTRPPRAACRSSRRTRASRGAGRLATAAASLPTPSALGHPPPAPLRGYPRASEKGHRSQRRKVAPPAAQPPPPWSLRSRRGGAGRCQSCLYITRVMALRCAPRP